MFYYDAGYVKFAWEILVETILAAVALVYHPCVHKSMYETNRISCKISIYFPKLREKLTLSHF